MPLLDKNGVVFYASAAEFLADQRANLACGGVLAESKANWKLRQKAVFRLQVAGLSGYTEFRAEVVFLGQGRVGLQIEQSPTWKAGLETLAAEAKEMQAAVPPTPSAPAPQEGQPVGCESERLSGMIAASGAGSDIFSISPVQLSPSACRQISAFCLISSIAHSGRAVSLTLSASGTTTVLRFNEKGNLVQFLNANSEMDLVERLAKRFVITRSQANEALALLGGGKQVENLLLEKKLVKLPQLWSAVRDQAIDALEQVRRTGSEFTLRGISTGRKSGVAFGSLMVPWLERALDALDRKLASERLRLLDQKYLVPVKEPRWPLESFSFHSKVDQFVRGYLDGSVTLAEALAKYPAAWHEKVRRAVWMLESLGLIHASDNPAESDDAPPEVLLAKELEVLEKASLFDQAGVHWSAHPKDYPQALQKLEQKYGPLGRLTGRSAECRRLCQKRMEMARSAATRLQDRSRRIEQRKQFIDEYQLANGALLLFRQAELMVLKNERAKARELLEMAIEIDGQAEYIRLLNSL